MYSMYLFVLYMSIFCIMTCAILPCYEYAVHRYCARAFGNFCGTPAWFIQHFFLIPRLRFHRLNMCHTLGTRVTSKLVLMSIVLRAGSALTVTTSLGASSNTDVS